MSLFTRPQVPSPEPTDSNVIMRFLTLGGATVDVTHPADSDCYSSRCQGCGWGDLDRTAETWSRDAANKHAGECRAMPRSEATR